jgi:hypothetical protein
VTGNVTGNCSGSSGSCTGLAATATKLATARAINGVDFDGSAAITITAAAGTLTGTTLKSTVVTSSLTTIGTLVAGAVPASLVTAGTFPAGNFVFQGNATIPALSKLYLDGGSNTYICESAADTIQIMCGNVEQVVVTNGTFKVTSAFGCNGKAAQGQYASGGALATYGAGANGFDSGANASALHALVVAIRAALVANGIMS